MKKLFVLLNEALDARAESTLEARGCLLYTSDAADERSSVDLGGRRIIKKKNITNRSGRTCPIERNGDT